jgi:predicted ATPase
MKIAIAGAHRVGKTTLAEKLLEYFSQYELRPEPYYELEELGHAFSETPNFDDFIVQLEYSVKQISKSEDNVIFDRCPIDLLAYMKAINESENIESFCHKVQNIMQEIDLLVFVPIENPDLISCPESEFSELRHQVNEILNEWIWNFDIETIEVTGTLSARVDQVIKKISQE